LVNQIRGLLAEYGIVIPQHVAQLRRHLPALLEDAGNELTSSTRCLFHSLYEELVELETKIAAADDRIERASARTRNASASPPSKALAQ
jgi:transposase